jgi:hypothetical protein
LHDKFPRLIPQNPGTAAQGENEAGAFQFTLGLILKTFKIQRLKSTKCPQVVPLEIEGWVCFAENIRTQRSPPHIPPHGNDLVLSGSD